MTDQAVMEKMTRQTMMTLASGVACSHTYSNSGLLVLAAAAATNPRAFIPTRSHYDSANLVVRNRSAQAELVSKITGSNQKTKLTALLLPTFSKIAKTKFAIFYDFSLPLSSRDLAVWGLRGLRALGRTLCVPPAERWDGRARSPLRAANCKKRPTLQDRGG